MLGTGPAYICILKRAGSGQQNHVGNKWCRRDDIHVVQAGSKYDRTVYLVSAGAAEGSHKQQVTL